MPWKETYTTRTGHKRYKIVTQDAAGKKSSKSFDRSKDADTYLLELKRKEQLGHLWQNDPETFGTFAGITVNEKDRVVLSGDGWFERYKPSVKKSTFDRRHSVIGHMRELLDIRLDKIQPSFLEEHIQVIAEDHPRQGKFVHETIQMILRSAQMRGHNLNPQLLTMRPPKYSPKRERQALSHDEVAALSEASDEPHLIVVAAYTGLRQGELFALRDEDIDFEAGVLHVNGNVYDRVRYETPKTSAGRRSVPLTKEVVQALRKQQMRRPAGTDIVFPSSDGRPMSQSWLDQKFKSWAKAIGKDITFHDLRSTFASFLVNETDIRPDVLKQLVGHKNISVTFDLYVKLDQRKKREAMDALSATVSGSETPTSPPSPDVASEETA